MRTEIITTIIGDDERRSAPGADDASTDTPESPETPSIDFDDAELASMRDGVVVERLAQRHVDGIADERETALLAAHPAAWVTALLRLYDDVGERADDARSLRGWERNLVLNDLDTERAAVDAVLTTLIGPATRQGGQNAPAPEPDVPAAGVALLQLSWTPGRVVAWMAGHGAETAEADTVVAHLATTGLSADVWTPADSVRLPNGTKAPTVSAPIAQVLGWLAALGNSADPSLGPSARWIGRVTAEAVLLACRGRMVPGLRKRSSGGAAGTPSRKDHGLFEVRWSPAVLDAEVVAGLAASLPGSVTANETRRDAETVVLSVIGDVLDAIGRTAATRLEVPPPRHDPRSRFDVAATFLARLDGTTFDAPARAGSELGRRLNQWSRTVAGTPDLQLTLTLAPPDDLGGWLLQVSAPDTDGALVPVSKAMEAADQARFKLLNDHLGRLDRIYPAMLRSSSSKRGQVILSQDEAWRLMGEVGETLASAGFDVRVPNLSKRKASPSLRLTADTAADSVVGAQQLADVRWSVVFDDLELTAEEIRALAAESRPLVQSRGEWIELDHADLAEAAAALAERDEQKQMTGAEMLRHALGLEGAPFGAVSLAGQSWAAELLRSARDIPDELPSRPEGFVGELRSYQSEAYTWLGFLHAAGLGGCLALDMGLGKTPTTLAHLAGASGRGPSLVIAPPAVVGNWAAEAAKFTPDMAVHVHHGANRLAGAGLLDRVERSDLVITTYGTAVRDIDDLEGIDWVDVVLDEAQAIKNPTSETALQLRKLRAHSKVCLTGTPIENGLGDLWSILDFCNPGLVGDRASFVSQLSASTKGDRGEGALRALNGIMVFRRTKAEPAIAAELPDRIDELDHCAMTPEQIGLYQAVLDDLVNERETETGAERKGAVLAAITKLKQICNHPAALGGDDDDIDRGELAGRSGKLARLEEIVDTVFASGERMLIFTHFASWGERLAEHLSERTGHQIDCYHGGLARGPRDKMVDRFQTEDGPGAMVLSLKAGGTGLNLTAASHVVLYDRWWNPAVEDQARDRVWRIGQKNTVICHRLVCPGTVDERVEEVVAGKRQIANMVLPKSSSVADLDADQLQVALGIDRSALLIDEPEPTPPPGDAEDAAAEVPA